MSLEGVSIARPENDAELLRLLGEAYTQRYSAKLEDFCQSQNPTLNELSEIFWRYGVLDRLVPVSHEERVARRTLGKDVFDGDMSDPELFWRILYVCAQVEAVDQSRVGERSAWLARPIEFTVQKLLNTDPALYEELFGSGDTTQNPDALFIATAREKAIQRLRDLGADPHLYPIPIGASLVYKDIPATVHGYTTDGLVVLQASNFEDHLSIVRANPRNICAVVASEIEV